ncbi:hypothetical protein JL722_3017 [Aureococcus anophagefferens]|nr:hypothetical protein JL722_3017 [Aureococcus anophagefferens]
MIWPEFRLHNAIFALRHVASAALALATGSHARPLALAAAVLPPSVAAPRRATDRVGDRDRRTTNAMPYPETCRAVDVRLTKALYASAQFGATAACLYGPATCAFAPLLGIEIAAFMMTAVRKRSDPIHTTYPFLTELLGNLPTDNNCPNLTCACGTQGRTELNGTHGFGSEDHFGVHTVEAAGVNGSRLRASGAYSLEEIEAIWGAALGEMDAYDTFLDNHLALWAPDLAPTSSASRPRPCRRSASGVRWVAVDEVRHRFEDGPPAVAAGRLEPLHVSRFAADLDVIEVFYDRVLGEKPSAVDFPLDEADPTSKRLVYGGPGSFTPDVALVFVTRAEPSNRARSASWFQRYAVAVGEHCMRNYTDCWPVWGDDRRDNHVAVQMNRVTPGAPTLDDVVANLDAMGWHLHHPFKGACKAPGDCGPSDICLMDPSGWTTQLVSPVGFKNTTLPGADVDSGGLSGYCFEFCEHLRAPCE